MGKYYVAGIPFDSENSLKHYGVKGMEWNKHKFGIDADDRYIKWLKNAGQNIGKFTTNAAQNVAKGATAAAKTVGSAVNKGANFVGSTANQAGKWAGQQAQNAGKTVSNAANQTSKWAGQQAQNAGKAIGNATENASKWATQTAQNAGKAIGTAAGNAAQNVGNAVGQAAQNVGEFITGRNANENLERLYAENIANGGNGMSPELTEARNRYNQTLPGMVEWVQDNLRENVAPEIEERVQNVGNAVSGAANKATEGTKGFLNSAGQWVSGAANNVKNTASKAASDAKKGASGFINNAGQWVSNAAGNVKNAAQNVGNTVGQAAQNVGNTVGQAAQNVGNTVGQAAEQARGGIGGFFDRVGNAVGGAANAVGDWAGNAAKDVGNAVGGAANQVGNWVGDQVQNVGNAVGGAANAVGDWAGNAVQNVGGAVQNAGNWIVDRTQDVRGAVQNAGQAVSNFVDQNITGNSAREDAQRYLDYAKKTDDRGGNWELDANGNRTFPNDGSLNANTQYWANKAAEAQRNADNSLAGRAANAAEYLTGNNARNALRDAQINWDNHVGRPLNDGNVRYAEKAQEVYGPVLDKAQEAYGRTLPGTIGNAAGNAVDWARNAAGNVGNAVSGAAGNVTDWARNAAGNVGNAVSGAAGNVADWARNAAGNVGDFVDYNVTGDYYNQQAKAWQDALNSSPANADMILAPNGMMTPRYNAERQLQNYSQDANNTLFGRIGQAAQNVGNFASEIANPQRRAYYEQNIREQTIPEQTIPEQLIREKLYHSAMDDKPEGVSDAFWEKFTADGGTREEYDRDWR